MNNFLDESDVLELIRRKRDSLSKGHKRIADFVLDNYEKCILYTATELGKMTDTSESTVVRFPIALGLSGYPEFQKRLGIILQNKIQSYEKIDISNSNYTSDMVIKNILTMDSRRIEYTLKNIDYTSFNVAVEDLIQAKNVYIVGVRNAEPLVDFLGYYLKMIRPNVFLIKSSNGNELFEQIMHITSDDVIVGISFPRYSMRTLKAMEYANNCNAKVIAITDSRHSPMSMYSSCNLLARTDMASVVESLVAPMSLINALVVSLCIRNSKNVVDNIEKLNNMLDNYSYEGNDEINMLNDDIISELKSMSENDKGEKYE